MRDKIKKWALLKAAGGLNAMADGLNVASGTLAALAAAARINASGEVWDDPLPCNCPACQLKRHLGIDGDGAVAVRVIPFSPGDLLGKAIHEAGGDPDGPPVRFQPAQWQDRARGSLTGGKGVQS